MTWIQKKGVFVNPLLTAMFPVLLLLVITDRRATPRRLFSNCSYRMGSPANTSQKVTEKRCPFQEVSCSSQKVQMQKLVPSTDHYAWHSSKRSCGDIFSSLAIAWAKNWAKKWQKIGRSFLSMFVLYLLCRITHQHFSQDSSEFITPCFVAEISKFHFREVLGLGGLTWNHVRTDAGRMCSGAKFAMISSALVSQCFHNLLFSRSKIFQIPTGDGGRLPKIGCMKKGCDCNTSRGDHTWNMFGASLPTSYCKWTVALQVAEGLP